MTALSKVDRQLLALRTAVRKQTDPIKQAKVKAKIAKIKSARAVAEWLGR